MKNKTNAYYLRELISSDSYSKEEALEFIWAIENELRDEKDKVARLETDNEEMGHTVSNHTTVFLGLDTLSYRLEKGNLKISQQLEDWINKIKKEN